VLTGDEFVHDRILNLALKCDGVPAFLRQIAKADSTESVDARIDECVGTEPMISVKAAFSIGTPGASLSRED
jgi:hypothetical protein